MVVIADKTEDEARALAWGVGLHLGVPLIQGADGSLIADVRDKGLDSSKTLRGNSSNAEVEFHVDNSDIVSLLCRRRARKGGKSLIVSSLSIHNELVVKYPELLTELYKPLPFIDLSKKEGASKRFFTAPIFAWEKGCFASRYYRIRILAAAELAEVPSLTEQQLEAVNAFHDVACLPELYFEMDLEPGDLQLLNNHVICHARTQFEDDEDHDKKRHLFRQWIATAKSRPLPPSFDGPYGKTEPGAIRGGYRGWEPTKEILSFQSRLALERGMVA